jgi:hypothetical protein
LSNTWYLENVIGAFNSLIIQSIASFLPSTSVETPIGIIETREAHVGLYTLHRISHWLLVILFYYCLSKDSRIRRACRIGSEVFTLFELFSSLIALKRLLFWNSPLTLCFLPLHFNY